VTERCCFLKSDSCRFPFIAINSKTSLIIIIYFFGIYVVVKQDCYWHFAEQYNDQKQCFVMQPWKNPPLPNSSLNIRIHCKKRLAIFPSSAEIGLVASRLGTEKLLSFFYSVLGKISIDPAPMNMHLYLVATVISAASVPSSARVSTAVISAIAAAAVLIAAIAAVAAVSVAAVALLYLAVAAALFYLRCQRRLVAAAEWKVNEPRFLAVILVILFSVGVVSLPLLES
jgi:hypothetical protein